MVASVRGVKPRPDEQIIVAAITGWTEDETGALYRYGALPGPNNKEIDYLPLCEGANGKATPAIRIKKFVEAFGSNGSLHSICANDFSPAMKQIGEKLAAKVGNPCIGAPLVDTRPDPGVQADCSVIDRVPAAGGGYQDQALPPCGAGNSTPCWKLAADPTCAQSGYKIDVDRGGMFAPPGTQQAIKCLTCARPDDARCKR
jgi:hypothetical protein